MAQTIFPETGDTITQAALAALLELLSGGFVSTGYTLSDGGGLNVTIATGTAFVSGFYITDDATNTEALTDDTTNHVYLNSDGTFTVNTTGTQPSDSLYLGTVTTVGGSVTGTTDKRRTLGIEADLLSILTTTGDIFYRDANGDVVRLAIGSTDQVLTISGGVPAWGVGNNFDSHKFTSTETWAALSSLGGETLVQLVVDMEAATVGKLQLKVDGAVVKTYNAGAAQEARIEAPASSLSLVSIDGGDNLISIDSGAQKIYSHSGITSTISSSFASPDLVSQDVDADSSGNAISLGSSSDKVYIHSGLTATISSSFSSPSTTPTGLCIDASDNLISCDVDSDKIYIHTGITATISSSFASPSISPQGLGIDASANLVSSDGSTNKIYHHSGKTSTISTSFAAPSTQPSGVHVDDNDDLVSSDPESNKIYHHTGITATISNSFADPAGGVQGVGATVGSWAGTGYATLNHA